VDVEAMKIIHYFPEDKPWNMSQAKASFPKHGLFPGGGLQNTVRKGKKREDNIKDNARPQLIVLP